MAKRLKKLILNGEAYDLTQPTPAATSSTAGVIKLGSDTAQSTAAQAVSSTANRTYALQVNSSGQGVVNVPWEDTTYSEVSKSDLDAGTSTTAGIIAAKSIADYVKGKVSNAYIYKGTVSTYADLPSTGLTAGDVYNVETAHTTDPKFPAGSNLAWDGETWDVLGGVFDTSSFVDVTSNQTIGGTKTFTTSPVVPSKTAAATNTGTAIATEAQVYTVASNLSTLDGNVVKLSGKQTIAGTKTFSTSPVVPSKTSDATNSGTAIATEAQVYKKLDSADLGNATISFYQGISSTASGSLTTNQSSAGSITFHDNVVKTQTEYDNLPSSKATDGNSYWIYETVS